MGLRATLDRLVAGERGDLGEVGLSETALAKPPFPVPRCSLWQFLQYGSPSCSTSKVESRRLLHTTQVRHVL